jgi:hypothetical protein
MYRYTRSSFVLKSYLAALLPCWFAAGPCRFHLMGGECNYLLRVNPRSKQLEFVPDDEWMTPEMLAWDEEDIKVRWR